MSVTTIKIYRNRIVIDDPKSGRTIDRRAMIPFSSSRLLIADEKKALDVITEALREVVTTRERWLNFSPRAKLLAMEMCDDGLSPVEAECLHRIGTSLGFVSLEVNQG